MTWALANIFKWFLLLPSSGHFPPPTPHPPSGLFSFQFLQELWGQTS